MMGLQISGGLVQDKKGHVLICQVFFVPKLYSDLLKKSLLSIYVRNPHFCLKNLVISKKSNHFQCMSKIFIFLPYSQKGHHL